MSIELEMTIIIPSSMFPVKLNTISQASNRTFASAELVPYMGRTAEWNFKIDRDVDANGRAEDTL